MDTSFIRHFTLFTILFFTINLCRAQDRSAQNTLQPPPAGITIDGKLEDWGDSLRYLNADKHITYSIANDKDNLYMAIRINDYSEQVMVLNAGLSLSVDPRGRKRKALQSPFLWAKKVRRQITASRVRVIIATSRNRNMMNWLRPN